jgi:hypothetical protein
MTWIGLNKAREKMDGLGLGNYSRVAEPRGAIEDDNRHCKIKTTKTGTHVASQTRGAVCGQPS